MHIDDKYFESVNKFLHCQWHNFFIILLQKQEISEQVEIQLSSWGVRRESFNPSPVLRAAGSELTSPFGNINYTV